MKFLKLLPLLALAYLLFALPAYAAGPSAESLLLELQADRTRLGQPSMGGYGSFDPLSGPEGPGLTFRQFQPGYHIYLSEWQWIDNELGQYWRAPVESGMGAFDLRTPAQAGVAGGRPQGYGLFVYSREILPLEFPSGNFLYLGTDPERVLTAGERTLLGLLNPDCWSGLPATSIIDLVWLLRTDRSSLSGQCQAALEPTIQGNLELFLPAYGKARTEAFRWGQHSHTAKLQELVQEGYRRVRQETLAGLRPVGSHQEYLTVLRDKYQIDDTDQFIPDDLPREQPLPRRTIFSDNFNRPNEELNVGLWTEHAVDWEVVSEKASNRSDNSTVGYARYTAVMDSGDHYAEAVVVTANTTGTTQRAGVIWRQDASSTTACSTNMIRNATLEPLIQLVTVVSGSISEKATYGGITYSLPDTIRGESNGSTTKVYWNTTEIISMTTCDTASGVPSTNVRGGLNTRIASDGDPGDVELDNFVEADLAAPTAPYDQSTYITGITIDWDSHREEDGASSNGANSDNWGVTWSDDGHQYAGWGDGGGFVGADNDCRVSLGFGRIEGDASSYTVHNVWGWTTGNEHGQNVSGTCTGADAENPAQFGGKNYAMISVAGVLYALVTPNAGADGYDEARLSYSSDYAATWTQESWVFDGDGSADPVIKPAFLNFGQDNASARDTYVYAYFIELQDNSELKVQIPGEILLARVPNDDITTQGSWEWFSGTVETPAWSSDVADRVPVFEDANGVGWNLSVTYNFGTGRYILITEHTQSFQSRMGWFEGEEPWGPWKTIAYYDAFATQTGGSLQRTLFYMNLSQKWSSGNDFVLVLTGISQNDSWNTVEGFFTVAAGGRRLIIN